MPGIHSPITKGLFLLDGLVKTSGGGGTLAKGQFAIVSNKAVAGGAKVISDFTGLPKSTPLKLRLGRFDNSQYRSTTAPFYETSYFTVEDVVSLKANYPKHLKQTFDDLIIGYDGINDNTAIELLEGQTTVFDIIISGDPVAVHTNGSSEYVVKMHFGRKVGETNQEAVERLVKNIQDFKLPMGTPLTQLIDIKVVNSENEALTGVPYVFSSLSVVDDGTSNALALVQAQYSYLVVRTAREGLTSTYTILHPQSVTLSDYTATSVEIYNKDCADCLAGYTALSAGVVYHITFEDDGVTQVSAVQGLPGAVADTAVKIGISDGKASYSVVLDNELTSAEEATFLATNAITSTATIKLLGDVTAVCRDINTSTTAWVAGQVCYASNQSYEIQLKDNDCGASRLTELQAAYPNLVIEAGDSSGLATQAVTITGSSGDMSLVVAGDTYTTTYSTSPTVTAAAFVTAHASAILAATGLVVTSSGAVITFAGEAEGFPVITAVAGGLTETVAAIDYVTTAVTGGCQRMYSTQVVTNIVCDECDPIFVQQFKSEAPVDFDFTSWTLASASTPSEDALMGVRLTGKPFIMTPTEYTRDEIPFYETSTRIEAFGGYIEEENENFQPIYSDIFNVKRLSRATDRDALGYHFLPLEEASRVHFLGEMRHENNRFANAFLGEESVLKFKKQYVTYELTVKDNKFSQGVGRSSDMGHTYLIFVEHGYEAGVEALLNKIAAKAGVETVNPTV